jgi:hypothetical protein
VVVLEPDFVPVADAVRPGLPTTVKSLDEVGRRRVD